VVRPARDRAVVDEMFRLREDYCPDPDRKGCDGEKMHENQAKIGFNHFG
jgi:hypothetical protein